MMFEYEVLKEKLKGTGCVVVSSDQVVLSLRDRESLERLTRADQLPYQWARYGDTDEAVSTQYYRIKVGGKPEILHPELMKIVNNDTFKNFLSQVTGIEDPELDRVQTHIYGSGDFLEKHIDTHSTPRYRYTCILILNDLYEGGHFRVYGKEVVDLKPTAFSLIIQQSDLPHEVLPILSGERRVLVFFLQEALV